MKNSYRIFLILLVFTILVGCKKDEQDTESPSPSASTQSPVSNIDEAKILQLVNALRESGCTCGSTAMPPVPALVWNDLLENAARAHSQEMSDSSYFSHTSLDGRTPGDRITAAGYSWNAYGENIAAGYTTEEDVVNGWRNSPGHCTNMMTAIFKDMGVAKVGNYWTQLFGRRP